MPCLARNTNALALHSVPPPTTKGPAIALAVGATSSLALPSSTALVVLIFLHDDQLVQGIFVSGDEPCPS